MGTRDARIDAYIAKSADFAHPILEHLRALVHDTCPDCEETIKWGMPHFMYRGQMMAGMAAFKEHCSFGFWKGALIEGLPSRGEVGMGHYGLIRSLKDLPPRRTLADFIRKAMAINEEGRAAPRKTKAAPKTALETPAELTAALAKNTKARTTFENFPPSHRREYITWIAEAKRPETRDRRVEQAVEWMAEGKGRNWKYERK